MVYEHIFKPITINTITLRNRIISTAHAEVYAEHGYPKDRYVKYYEEKAKGGLSLAICGGSSPVSRDSPYSWWQSVNLADDGVVPYLQTLADSMHKWGAKIMIQATHMGRRTNYYGEHWPHLVSPSGIREPVHRGVAKTIELSDIKRIIKDFAMAAKRTKDGGLDGVEVSAAHQQLIDQFWSKRVNKRTDSFGGSLENRMRFGFEVLRAIREEVGKDYCVGIRMCGDEFHHNGIDHEEAKDIAQALSDSKLIDFISVVGSGADTHNTIANCMPPMALPPEPFLHLAAGIKSVVNVPVMHAQSIKDPTQAERILKDGLVDLVGMTRAHMADPYLVSKIREGKDAQIKQCVGANYCIDRQYKGQDVLCIQNAATSREATMPHNITPNSKHKRKVVIVGAGPAGLEAARVSASRGHDVVLFEKDDSVGGQIILASKAPQRDQMGGIVRWFSMEIKRLGVNLKLNAQADEQAILAEDPDIVVIATGGRPNMTEVEEWGFADNLIVSSWDILSGRVEVGNSVLVYDSFNAHSGSGVADFMAKKGALVELVTPDAMVAEDTGGTTFPIFYRSLCASDVIFTPNYILEKVYREQDTLIARLRHEYTHKLEEREVEQVVVENGTLPNTTLYDALKERSLNKGVIDIDRLYDAKAQPCLENIKDGEFTLFRVGESICPRNIHGCIYDSLRLCKDF